jgi:hypothetical protein
MCCLSQASKSRLSAYQSRLHNLQIGSRKQERGEDVDQEREREREAERERPGEVDREVEVDPE